MTDLVGRSAVKQVTIEAVVLGPCSVCGVGAEFHPDDHVFDPTFRRDLGTVSRWHKNPLIRLWWRVSSRRGGG